MAGLGATALEALLPSGSDVYVALYADELVISTETGTELTDANYARVAFQDWKTVVGASSVTRTNNTAIVFPAFDAKVESIRWWGIWDASVGGNLLAAGPITSGGVPADVGAGPGDQFRLNSETLYLKSQDGV